MTSGVIMIRYEWHRLNHLQLGKYAEYFVKMEFTMFGWEVYTSEVDDRGIDFVARTGPGSFFEVQVKSVRGRNYIFFAKEKFKVRDNLVAAVVLFDERKPPSLFVIPSMDWSCPNDLLCSRDYEGKKSLPEWGINLSSKNQSLLDTYAFDQMIEKLGRHDSGSAGLILNSHT